MPTWEETVARYGLSKADQKFVASLFEGKNPRRSTSYALKTRAASTKPMKSKARKTTGTARKTNNRANKAA
jgi:hypothetical protein